MDAVFVRVDNKLYDQFVFFIGYGSYAKISFDNFTPQNINKF